MLNWFKIIQGSLGLEKSFYINKTSEKNRKVIILIHNKFKSKLN